MFLFRACNLSLTLPNHHCELAAPCSEVQANAGVCEVTCGPVGPGDARRFDVIGKLVNDVVRMPSDGVALSPALRELMEQAN